MNCYKIKYSKSSDSHGIVRACAVKAEHAEEAVGLFNIASLHESSSIILLDIECIDRNIENELLSSMGKLRAKCEKITKEKFREEYPCIEDELPIGCHGHGCDDKCDWHVEDHECTDISGNYCGHPAHSR